MTAAYSGPRLDRGTPPVPYNPRDERRTQVAEARTDMTRDFSAAPRFPWIALHEATGPLLPGELWIVSAKTGQGKSLFVLNWVNAMIAGKRGVAVCPLEVPPKDFLKRLACCRAGIDPVPFFRNQWDRMPREARGLMDAEFARLERSDRRLQVRNAPRLTQAQLPRMVEDTVAHGATVVIIDHLLRMVHGPGVNLYAEVSETIRMAKELAKEHGIVIVFTSQQGRAKDGDRVAAFRPPDLSSLKGTGEIENEADAVLFLYRPLKVGLAAADLKAFRDGDTELSKILEPERMAVSVAKHRLDGSALGRLVMLRVKHGIVSDVYGPALVTPPAGDMEAQYALDERAAMEEVT